MEPKPEEKVIPVPAPVLLEENYAEFLEWTPEEEEAFLKIIKDKGSEFV